MNLLTHVRPRTWRDAMLTYPRFLGTIKPSLLAGAEAEFQTRLQCLSKAWWPKKLTVPVGRRILVIAPHADDEAIGAGGLLLSHRGISEIALLSVFNGECGGSLASGPWRDDQNYKEELVLARRREFEGSAARLGAEIVGSLDLPDLTTLPTLKDAERLRRIVKETCPDVVILPWLLDRHRDHRVTNVLYAWGCADLNVIVLGFELWDLIQGNAMLDISAVADEKLKLIGIYRSQLSTVDYLSMSQSLARVRAFTHKVRSDRSGAVEAYLALPNREYCEFVQCMFGPPGKLRFPEEALF